MREVGREGNSDPFLISVNYYEFPDSIGPRIREAVVVGVKVLTHQDSIESPLHLPAYSEAALFVA